MSVLLAVGKRAATAMNEYWSAPAFGGVRTVVRDGDDFGDAAPPTLGATLTVVLATGGERIGAAAVATAGERICAAAVATIGERIDVAAVALPAAATGGNGICPARFSAAKTSASFMSSLHTRSERVQARTHTHCTSILRNVRSCTAGNID